MSAPPQDKEKKKRKDHEVVPDYDAGVPAVGTVAYIPNQRDQYHAFQVFGKRYVFFNIFHLFLRSLPS